MRRHAGLAVLFTAACLALTGCSSSDDSNGTDPAETQPAATSTAPEVSAADQLQACTEAIADGGDSNSPECADLSPDAYMEAMQDANQQGRDALQDLIDEASQDAQP